MLGALTIVKLTVISLLKRIRIILMTIRHPLIH